MSHHPYKKLESSFVPGTDPRRYGSAWEISLKALLWRTCLAGPPQSSLSWQLSLLFSLLRNLSPDFKGESVFPLKVLSCLDVQVLHHFCPMLSLLLGGPIMTLRPLCSNNLPSCRALWITGQCPFQTCFIWHYYLISLPLCSCLLH